MEDRTLFIIDGHSQVFKAYHAIQQLSTSTGIPTNATFGFVQILHKLLKTRSPQYLVVTFDTGADTFRHDMFDAYKANRPPPPEDLPLQMSHITEILNAQNIPILQLDGYEADDIIATVSRQAAQEGFNVIIVSADKDLMQLIDDRIHMLRLEPDKETEFDRQGVREKLGVYPERVVDLLAMIGDASDNVPGIHKVGPKTAVALLDQFGTLDNTLANTDKLKGKQKEYVEAGRENALLSKKLVTLCDHVPIDFKCGDFARRLPDYTRLAAVYKQLEFRKLFNDLTQPPAPRQTNYQVINTLDALAEFCARAKRAGAFAIDTETDSLSSISGNLVGISMSTTAHEGGYVPIGHHPELTGIIEQLRIDEIFPVLNPLLRDPKVLKIGHHLKFDRKMLMKYGFEFSEPMSDTMLQSYLLNPDKRGHGLKALAAELLGIQMTPITGLIGSGASQTTFALVDIEQAASYACADADVTFQLCELLTPRLRDSGMSGLYERVEMPLISVLIDMEMCGVRIDPQHFTSLAAEMRAELNRLEGRIHELAGHPFNISSPRQVAQVLFDELKLTPGKQKKTGYSTDVDVLEELAGQHEVARLLLEYRQYEKLKSTYVDVLPGLVEKITGRIHTTYNQAMAATGRLSSSDPNLQNIPVRTGMGRKIREGFIPAQTGNVFISADYSQIELRVLAHVSNDPALMAAFREDRDIHTLTASKVFGVELAGVTPQMRDTAKIVNFGIIYGMSDFGLSQRLKISRPHARKFIDEYFAAYTGVRAWIDAVLEGARKDGFVTTIAGRRRYLAGINSSNYNTRSAAERVAVNAPIQGTSADMIKIAMINICRWLKDSDLRARMIMQVHDELIFDVPACELAEVSARVRELMQSALPLAVPVKVDIKTGANWAEC
ncbi:MAG: DNA polymerase I [Candidatus Sumerlaeota bacterium]|nr:DNA polymerase I [Candidatus Sumerlaeota bacterium]